MSTSALTPAAFVSVDEYLRLAEKPNVEYREGTLQPKPIPTKFHGLLEFMLVAMLRKLGSIQRLR